MTIVFRLFTLHRPNKIINKIQPDNIKLSLKQNIESVFSYNIPCYFCLISSKI